MKKFITIYKSLKYDGSFADVVPLPMWFLCRCGSFADEKMFYVALCDIEHLFHFSIFSLKK